MHGKIAELRFQERLNRLASVSLHNLDILLEQAPGETCLFWKDDKFRYAGANLAYAKLEEYQSPENLLGKTDYDIPHFMLNHDPLAIKQEDISCMKNSPIINKKGIFIYSGEQSTIGMYSKIPIVSKKKHIGMMCCLVDVTSIVLSPDCQIKPETVVQRTTSFPLTPKEIAVLKLYNQGYPRKLAAHTLHISENTYAWYLKEIRYKFKIRTRSEMLDLENSLF